MFAYHWFLAFSNIHEDQHTPDLMRAKPGETRDAPQICMTILGSGGDEDKPYRGWMVFKHLDEINEQTKEIVHALAHDELQGCTLAYCTTLCYDPDSSGPGP